MKTGEFLTIGSKAKTSEDPVRYPTWGSAGLELEQGETRHQQAISKFARCYRGPKKQQIWDLEGKTDIEVTDRRVAYFCDKFLKGGGFSLTGKAISSAVAVSRRTGRAAIGQVRFEWPTSVQFSGQSGLGLKASYIVLANDVHGTEYAVWFGIGHDAAPEWATYLTQLIATFRLAHSEDLSLSSEVTAELMQQQAEATARETQPRGALLGKEPSRRLPVSVLSNHLKRSCL